MTGFQPVSYPARAAAPSGLLSQPEWTSSTTVWPGSPGMNVTSTLVASAAGVPACQVKATPGGGSQRVTVPHTDVVPSASDSTMLPPAPSPNTTPTAWSPPTEWVASGHHSPMRAVNSSNARCGVTGTVTVLRTGAVFIALIRHPLSHHPAAAGPRPRPSRQAGAIEASRLSAGTAYARIARGRSALIPEEEGSMSEENPRQNVTFASNGGQAHGYLATPASGHGPGVVVIQEWWGLDDHIVDIADRLAAEGFVALAPDLYGGRVAHDAGDAGTFMGELPAEQAARDLGGAVDYLLASDAVTSAKVGTVG